MMGREVCVPDAPSRILSLVPSQTELLCDLGLADHLVGVTKFCIHPTGIRKKAGIVGGTKQIRWERLSAMSPDLVIANKEENEKEMIERLAEDYPVWMSDVRTLDQALDMIRGIGLVTNKGTEADAMSDTILKAFEPCFPVEEGHKPRVLYLIWRDPWMGVASNTFIHDMIGRAGYRNALEHLERYPILTDVAIMDLDPDFVFLSSEPYPFGEKHLEECSRLVPDAGIQLVDGEMFSWYGSRLLLAPAYFARLQSDLRQTFT